MRRHSRSSKFFSVLLTMIMVLSTLNIPAFAANDEPNSPEPIIQSSEETSQAEENDNEEEREAVDTTITLTPGEIRRTLKTLQGQQRVEVKTAFCLGSDEPLVIPTGLYLTLAGEKVWRKEGSKKPLFLIQEGASLTLDGILMEDLAQDAATLLVEGSGSFALGTGTVKAQAMDAQGNYGPLAAVLKAAQSNRITLLDDIEIQEPLQIEKMLTLDLNGHTLTAIGCAVFKVNAPNEALTLASSQGEGTVRAVDAGKKGTIQVSNCELMVESNVVVEGTAGYGIVAQNAAVIIHQGATVRSHADSWFEGSGAAAILAIAKEGQRTLVRVAGKVEATGALGVYGITGNNAIDNIGECQFEIESGAEVYANMGPAMFLPNDHDRTYITNATVRGTTGIEIRGGNLGISDSIIEGTWQFDYRPSTNGNTTHGVGVAISRHVRNPRINVEIKDSTVIGEYAVYEHNLVSDSPDSEIDIQLYSGTYISRKNDRNPDKGVAADQLQAVASENQKITVTGGYYTQDPEQYYAHDEYQAVLQEDGKVLVKRIEVARIGDTTYPTLAKAIAAARAEQTVELLENVQECITIEADDIITLNLNGHTITNVEGKKNHTITVKEGGSLVLEGSGVVDNISHQAAALWNEGTVKINSGTLTRSQERGTDTANGNSYYTVVNRGMMTIGDGINDDQDVSILQNGTYSSLIQNGIGNAAASEDSRLAELIINGGVFDHGKINLKNEAYGHAVINGGVFKASAWALCNYGEAEINSGVFTVEESGLIYNCMDTAESQNPRQNKLTVRGGDFTYKRNTYGIYDYNSENTQIIGGTYCTQHLYRDITEKKNIINNDVNYFVLPITHGRFAQEDGTYIVRPLTQEDAVARIGETLYATLANALAHAEDGDVVELLKEAPVASRINIDKTVQLNLNGCTVTMMPKSSITIVDGKTVTVTGNGYVNAQTIYPAFTVAEGSLIIENGTFTMQDGAHLFGEADARTNCKIVVVEAGQEAVIEDGTFIAEGASNDGILTATGADAKLTMLAGTIRAVNSCMIGNITTGPSGVVISNGGIAVLGDEDAKTGPVVDVFASAVGMNNLKATSRLTIYGGTYTTHNTYQTGDVVGAEKFNSLLYLSAAGHTDIYGGSFLSANPTESAHLIALPYQNADHVLNVYGGDFTSSGEVFFLGTENGAASDGSVQVSVTGGTYSDDVELMGVCAEQYGTTSLPADRYLVRAQDCITVHWNDGMNHTLQTEYLLRSLNDLAGVQFPAEPVREGYHFDGWAEPVEGASGVYVITAQWRVMETPISATWVNGYNDTILKAMTGITSENPVTEDDYPAAPAREGFTFDGWVQTADEQGNLIFTATWVENQPEVPENPGGPTTPTTPVAPTEPTVPATPTTPNEPTTPTAPVVPAQTPTPPVTPAAPAAQQQPPVTPTAPTVEVEENETPLASPEQTIDEPEVPLAPTPEMEEAAEETWSLLNLILMLGGIAGAIMVLIKMLVKKKGATYLLGVIPAVVGIVVFSLTTSFAGAMAFTDGWTWLMAIAAVLQGIITAAAYISSKRTHS